MTPDEISGRVEVTQGGKRDLTNSMAITPFALALKQSCLRPIDFCRAVEKLSGVKYLPVMTSRWIQGVHEAPAPAIALAVLLARLPDGERNILIQGPPRKKYTRKKKK